MRFWKEVLSVQPSTWNDGTNEIVKETPYYKFRVFRAKGQRRPRCIFLVPPFAGRDGTICNTLIFLLQSLGYDVWVFDLLSANWWNNAVNLRMLAGFVKDCYRIPQQPKIVFSVCMGMWLSLLALEGEEKPLAQFCYAGPADTSKGTNRMRQEELKKIPFWTFSLPVLMTGVNPAWLQWWRFTMAYDPKVVFVDKFKKLEKYISEGDDEAIRRWRRDQGWYWNPLNLGLWFPEAVQKIFRENGLRNMVDLNKYDWPFRIYAGRQDEITHWEQTTALADMVGSSDVQVFVFEKGGHTITFNGSEQMKKTMEDLMKLEEIWCREELLAA